MINILMQCDRICKNQECCHNRSPDECDCYKCLHDDLYGGQDTYSCLKKLCSYTMNFGPIYVSEIYHFLSQTQILNNYIRRNINILSLGCGFGPDYIAVMKYIKRNNLNINVTYHGIDIEPLWGNIRNGILPNDCFFVRDVLNGFNLAGYHIIFINKLFSTLKNNARGENFLNILADEIDRNLAYGSYLVFNDVNHFKLGHDEFHTKIVRILPQHVCYFFNVRDAYRGNYIEIRDTHNICQIPQGLASEPARQATKRSFFYIGKNEVIHYDNKCKQTNRYTSFLQ